MNVPFIGLAASPIVAMLEYSLQLHSCMNWPRACIILSPIPHKTMKRQAMSSRNSRASKKKAERRSLEDSEKDAYIFEIEHMDHSNPFWLPTIICCIVALIAFAYELYAANSDGGTMVWVFAGILVVSLICLWYLQRKYKAWEESRSPQAQDDVSKKA